MKKVSWAALGALLTLATCAVIPASLSQINCAVVPYVAPFVPSHVVGGRSAVSTTAVSGSGFVVNCSLVVVNDGIGGDFELALVQVKDNLREHFYENITPAADSVHFLQYLTPVGDALTTDASFTGGVNEGSWPADSLADSTTTNVDIIVPGDSGTVVLEVYFEPGTATQPIPNPMTAQFVDQDGGVGLFGVSFLQDIYWPTSANVGIAYQNPVIFDRGTGSYDVTFELVVNNPGITTLDTLQVYADIQTIFTTATSVSVTSVTSARSITLATYGGAGEDSVYAATATMAAGTAAADTLYFDVLVEADTSAVFTYAATAYAAVGTDNTTATTGDQTITIPTPTQPGTDFAIYAEVLSGQDNFVIGMMPFPPTGANSMSVGDFDAGTWQIHRSGTPVDADSVAVELFEDGKNVYPNGNVRGVRYSFYSDHGTGVGTYELVNTASAQPGFAGLGTPGDLDFAILVGFDKDADGDYFENDAGAHVDTMTFGPGEDVEWSTSATLFTGEVFTLPDNATYAWTFAQKAHADTTDLKILVWTQHMSNGKQRVWFAPWNDREYAGDMYSDPAEGRENWKWYTATTTGQVLDFEIKLVNIAGTHKILTAYASSMNLATTQAVSVDMWTKTTWDTTAYVAAGGLVPMYAAKLRGGERVWMEVLVGSSSEMTGITDADPSYNYCDAARYVESKFPAMFMEEYALPTQAADSVKNWYERFVFGATGWLGGQSRWDDTNHEASNDFHRNPRDHGAVFLDNDTSGQAPQPYHYHALGGEYQYDEQMMTHWARAASSATVPAGAAKAYYMKARQEVMVGCNPIAHFTEDFDNNPKKGAGEIRVSDAMKGFAESHPKHTTEGVAQPHMNDGPWPDIAHWCPPAAILAYQIYSLPYMRDEHAWLEFSFNRRSFMWEIGSSGLGDFHWGQEERASGYLFSFAKSHLLFDPGDVEVEGHLRAGIPATWEGDEHGMVSGDYSLTTREKAWMQAQAITAAWDLGEMWGMLGNTADSTIVVGYAERGGDWIAGRACASTHFVYDPNTDDNKWDRTVEEGPYPGIENSIVYEMLPADGSAENVSGAMPWGNVAASAMAGLGHPQALEVYTQAMKYPSYYTAQPPTAPTVEESNTVKDAIFRFRGGMRYLVVGQR